MRPRNIVVVLQVFLIFLTLLSLLVAATTVGTPNADARLLVQLVDAVFFQFIREYNMPPPGPALSLIIAVLTAKRWSGDRLHRRLLMVALLLHTPVTVLFGLGALVGPRVHVN